MTFQTPDNSPTPRQTPDSGINKPLNPNAKTAAKTMQQVLLALVPGILCMAWLAPQSVWVIALTTFGALAAEYGCVTLRFSGYQARQTLKDSSALVTGVLMGICLPASISWWLALGTGALAIGLGKQLYGGLGANPFNPTMVAYLVLLLGFPVQASQWALNVEGMTGPTLLDRAQTLPNTLWSQTDAFFWAQLIAGGFALGGLWLIRQGVLRRTIPAAALASFMMTFMILTLSSGQSLFAALTQASTHLWLGGIIFAAFFIATDPVSAPKNRQAQLVYALVIGALTAIIRDGGQYPEGVAFAVICANILGPTLDRFFNQQDGTNSAIKK